MTVETQEVLDEEQDKWGGESTQYQHTIASLKCELQQAQQQLEGLKLQKVCLSWRGVGRGWSCRAPS